ncbi:MAG: RpiB/LacA/LacB family sugar-phosphate isomerase, partial [Candidatus Omnitrophota bacterium]
CPKCGEETLRTTEHVTFCALKKCGYSATKQASMFTEYPKIVIGSDHNGFALKGCLILSLASLNIETHDVGCFHSEKCDYEEPGFAVARLVAAQSSTWRGIAICGNGIGMSIVTNKDNNIRGALCTSVDDAVQSRILCDSNVLVLPANKLTSQDAELIVYSWLNTKNGKRK